MLKRMDKVSRICRNEFIESEETTMKNQNNLYAILTGVFCASLIISNILAFKTFCLGNVVLPAAVIVFPIVYIVNDTMTEIFGYKKARMTILTAFAMNVIAVFAYKVAITLPYPIYFTGQEAFAEVLSNSLRVLVASMLAYIVGSLANAKIMARMKNNSRLMTRCVLSTLCGEGLDALIFISIAFYGTMPIASLTIMIISQAIFKTVYEIIVFPITRSIINKSKKIYGGVIVESGNL